MLLLPATEKAERASKIEIFETLISSLIATN